MEATEAPPTTAEAPPVPPVCRHSYKEWNETYEKMSSNIVPRSSKLIFEDSEYGLYRIITFKKSADEFKIGACVPVGRA